MSGVEQSHRGSFDRKRAFRPQHHAHGRYSSSDEENIIRTSGADDEGVCAAIHSRIGRGCGNQDAFRPEVLNELALAAINAAIRADKMGFRTYKVEKAVPLRDGTPVDRIFKRYVVES